MKIEYLLFNAVIFCSSTLSTWLYPSGIRPRILQAISAVTAVALPFIVLDVFVNNWFWYFNQKYILGWKIFGLPIEEALFFFTVPWACLLLWINIKPLSSKAIQGVRIGWIVRGVLCFAFMVTTLQQLWYSSAVLGALFVLSIFFQWQRIRVSVLLFGAVTMVLTLLFNMYLTGRPIVLYNSNVMSNLRIGSIPVEDFGYGLILIFCVVYLYERLSLPESWRAHDTEEEC